MTGARPGAPAGAALARLAALPSRVRAALVVVGVWTAIGLLLAQQSYVIRVAGGYPKPWPRLLAYSLLGAWVWAAATPAIAWLARRFPLERPRVVPHLALHLAAVAAMTAIDALTSRLLAPILGNAVAPFGLLVARLVVSDLSLYTGVAGVATAIDFARRYRERAVAAAELSARLTQAQLHMLQSQIRPHFLFNTLNAIAEQIHVEPAAADRMVMRLSALLRASLTLAERHEVPLREELATLRHYLDIMTVRHRGRLAVEVEVADALEGALVPAMVLQPLVENAIHHGAEPSDRPTRVAVRASREGDSLVLTVEDDGVGLDGGVARAGLGLRNTRERLRQLHGGRQSLDVEPRAGGGVVSRVMVPWRDARRGTRDA